MSETITTVVNITGMHCPSCDILVRIKLKDVSSISDVIPDQKNNTLTLKHSHPITLDEINSVLCEYGYKVSSLHDAVTRSEPKLSSRITEAFTYITLVGALLYFVQEFNLIPTLSSNPTLGLTGAFVLGLVASISTCMATTGAVLAGYIHLVKDQSKATYMTLLFLMGRVLGYAFFGFVIGFFGETFAAITSLGGVLSVFVALSLFVVALDMLQIVRLSTLFNFVPGMDKLRWNLANRSTSRSSAAGAMILGVATYFLPCGFSLTTQAYALSTGNPLNSSLVMTAFAIGTIPSLFALSLVTKLRHTHFYNQAIKVLGALMLLIGFSYILSFANLYGVSFGSNTFSSAGETVVQMQDGKQVAKMTATSSGYSPNYFVVKKGIPVRWEIDGKEIFGCQGTLQSPKAGIKLTYLKQGENIIEFTPSSTGDIQFSCSMGMFTGTFKVI